MVVYSSSNKRKERKGAEAQRFINANNVKTICAFAYREVGKGREHGAEALPRRSGGVKIHIYHLKLYPKLPLQTIAPQSSEVTGMPDQHIDRNKLLLKMNNRIRKLNREIINPEIPELTLDDLTPAILMVARARAAYLKQFCQIAHAVGEGLPDLDQVKKLRDLRLVVDELVNGVKAVECAIEHNYLDIQTK